MSAPDHLAQVRQLRAFSGAHREQDAVLSDMLTGARRVESILVQAQTFPLRPRALQDLENALEGLRRSAIELRTRIAPNEPEAA
jgi:hypothetical protein